MLPIPNGDEKEKEPTTMGLYLVIAEMRQDIVTQVQTVGATIASLLKTSIETKGLLEQIGKNVVDANIQRLQLEIQEGEEDIHRLNSIIESLQEKLEIKKSAKVNALDTNERMKSISKETLEEANEKQQLERAARWERRKEAVVTALLVSFALTVFTALIGFAGWLVLQYLTFRGIIP